MIIYFSGTGNGLQITKHIASKTNDTITTLTKAHKIDLSNEDVLGFVFPVYNYNIPLFIERILKSLSLNPSAYIYVIACHGGDVGNTIFNFKTIVEHKGCKLAYASDFKMPVNSRIMYGRITDQIEKRISASKPKLDDVSTDIINRVHNTARIKERRILSIVGNYFNGDKMRSRLTPCVDREACINCGICIKVCPVLNITEMDDKAQIGNFCAQCMTCMHWCPQTAIHFAKRRVKSKQQYHHPDFKWTDIKQ